LGQGLRELEREIGRAVVEGDIESEFIEQGSPLLGTSRDAHCASCLNASDLPDR
jgi:hypothetical protein